jgi:hypothetical protein
LVHIFFCATFSSFVFVSWQAVCIYTKFERERGGQIAVAQEFSIFLSTAALSAPSLALSGWVGLW